MANIQLHGVTHKWFPSEVSEPKSVDPETDDESRFMKALGLQLQLLGDMVRQLGAASVDNQGKLITISRILERSTQNLAASSDFDYNSERALSAGVAFGPRSFADADRAAPVALAGTQVVALSGTQVPVFSEDTSLSAVTPEEVTLAENKAAVEMKEDAQGGMTWEEQAELKFKRASVTLRKGENLVCEVEAGWRQNMQDLVTWRYFEPAVGIVIAINALTIGYDTSIQQQGGETPAILVALEILFFMVYASELIVRIAAFGFIVLKSHWVKFDLTIVSVMAIDFIVVLLPTADADGFFEQSDGYTTLQDCATGSRGALADAVQDIVAFGARVVELVPDIGVYVNGDICSFVYLRSSGP